MSGMARDQASRLTEIDEPEGRLSGFVTTSQPSLGNFSTARTNRTATAVPRCARLDALDYICIRKCAGKYLLVLEYSDAGSARTRSNLTRTVPDGHDTCSSRMVRNFCLDLIISASSDALQL